MRRGGQSEGFACWLCVCATTTRGDASTQRKNGQQAVAPAGKVTAGLVRTAACPPVIFVSAYSRNPHPRSDCTCVTFSLRHEDHDGTDLVGKQVAIEIFLKKCAEVCGSRCAKNSTSLERTRVGLDPKIMDDIQGGAHSIPLPLDLFSFEAGYPVVFHLIGILSPSDSGSYIPSSVHSLPRLLQILPISQFIGDRK
jgi:hypothetical protein